MLFLICRTFTYSVYENVRVMYYSLKCFILVWLLNVHRECIIAVHKPKKRRRGEKKENLTISFYVAHIYIPPCNFNSLHFCLSRHSTWYTSEEMKLIFMADISTYITLPYISTHIYPTYKFYVIPCWNEICAIKHLFHDIHWKLLV